MIYYKIGDVVEITHLVCLDAKLGIKLGDIAKVVMVENHDDGSQMVGCYNPKWGHENVNGTRVMVRSQIRKVK